MPVRRPLTRLAIKWYFSEKSYEKLLYSILIICVAIILYREMADYICLSSLREEENEINMK